MRNFCLLACLVVAAGCSPLNGTRAPEKVPRAEDQARAETIVFHIGDFPAGWYSQPSPDDSAQGGGDCLEPNMSDLTVNGEAQSDYFGSETDFAFSFASIFESEADARSAFDRYLEQDLARCVADAVSEGIEQAAKDHGQLANTRTSSVQGIDLGTIGDRAQGYRARVEFTVGPATIPAVIDFGIVQRERAIAMVVYLSIFHPFPTGLEQELTGGVAQRMEP
jgi:hypothetical protein